MTVHEMRGILAGRAGAESIKIDGYDISHIDNVPAEGGFPGYLDLTPACSLAVRS